MTASNLPAGTRKVGILAGWGRYPVVIAEALRAQGYEVCCLGVKGHADPALGKLSHEFGWVGLAKIGQAIRFFRRAQCACTSRWPARSTSFCCFQPWAWFKHCRTGARSGRFIRTLSPRKKTAATTRC